MVEPAGNERGGAPYQVVARRFRPQTFQEVVGQDDVLQSLRIALQQKKVPHAFLFSGSRGVGKTTSARILARCLNCATGPTPEPCGTCDLCRSILDGSNPDVIEIDAASNNSVEDVRQLREHAGFATMRSRYRVVILDEVHMLSKGAFNALLKTLEEPPPGVVFVLATTELHKVPETIRSRCQVLLFRRVGESDLQRRLRMIAEREGVHVPDDVLAEIAGSVRGGVRDAETALERLLPLARELGDRFDLAAYRSLVARVGFAAVVEVVDALLRGDARAGLHFAHELQQRGTDEREALGELVEVLRWLLLLKVDGPDTGLVPVAGAERERLQRLAAGTEPHRLDAMIAAGLLGRERLRRLEDRAVVLEVALVRMSEAGTLPTLAQLLAEVRGGGTGVVATPSAPTPPSSGPRAAAPAPAVRGAPPPPAAADLRTRVLSMLKERPLQQAAVEMCRLDGPDANGVVTVTPQTDKKLFLDRLASPVQQQEITKVVVEAVGSPVQVLFRLPEAGGAGAAAPRAGAGAPAGPAAPAPSGKHAPGPAARRVIETFRGRIVEVNPADRVKPVSPEPPSGEDGAPVDEVPPEPTE